MPRPKRKYDIGFGKPPQASRFKKGRSGNAKGRPKGKAGFNAILAAELQAKIPIVENGKTKKITFERAIAKQVKTKAASGDLKAAAMLVKQVEQIERAGPAKDPFAALDTQDHRKIIADLVRRIRSLDAPAQEN